MARFRSALPALRRIGLAEGRDGTESADLWRGGTARSPLSYEPTRVFVAGFPGHVGSVFPLHVRVGISDGEPQDDEAGGVNFLTTETQRHREIFRIFGPRSQQFDFLCGSVSLW